MNGDPAPEPTRLRLDKWLWFARFYKSRTLAAGAAGSGRMRLNGTLVGKPHQTVKAGDVLTFPHGPRIRVVRVVAVGERRGPASEARLLYEDLSDAVEPTPDASPAPGAGGGASRPEHRTVDRPRGR